MNPIGLPSGVNPGPGGGGIWITRPTNPNQPNLPTMTGSPGRGTGGTIVTRVNPNYSPPPPRPRPVIAAASRVPGPFAATGYGLPFGVTPRRYIGS